MASTYAKDDRLVVGGDGSKATVSYNCAIIQDYTYSNETISWSSTNGNISSASIAFFVNTDTSKGATTGSQFIGEFKPAGGTTNVPTSNNFFARIGSSSSSNSPRPPEAMVRFKIIANNVMVAFACMYLNEKVVAGIKAAIKFSRLPRLKMSRP